MKLDRSEYVEVTLEFQGQKKQILMKSEYDGIEQYERLRAIVYQDFDTKSTDEADLVKVEVEGKDYSFKHVRTDHPLHREYFDSIDRYWIKQHHNM